MHLKLAKMEPLFVSSVLCCCSIVSVHVPDKSFGNSFKHWNYFASLQIYLLAVERIIESFDNHL